MGIAVNLDEKLIEAARIQSKALHRSVTKQIEHWAQIGHIAEDNPDLTYMQIREILLGKNDYKSDKVKDYKRGKL